MRRLLGFVLLSLVAVGCLGAGSTGAPSRVAIARTARGSGDAEAVGAWLLAELLLPEGQSDEAERARAELDRLGTTGMLASLARAIDADVHGRLPQATAAYLHVIDGARTSVRPEASLYGWFAASRLDAHRSAVAGLWLRGEPIVRRAIDSPGHLGWRARASLVKWRAHEQSRKAVALSAHELREQAAREEGCVREASFAGPFGRAGPGDHRVQFEAERAAPWPLRFEPTLAGRRAEKFAAEARGCALSSRVRMPDGIYYAQTFVVTPEPSDVLLAVFGAYAVFVDDTVVLTRDEAEWASRPRLGVRLRLGAGRHRILARLGRPDTSIRLFGPDGRPFDGATSADDTPPYSLTPPERLSDPNPLEPFLRGFSDKPSASAATEVDLDDAVARFVAASLAASEGYRDIASVLMLPLVEAKKPTPVSLAHAAQFVQNDPIFTAEQARTTARELYTRAVQADPNLWAPALWLVLDRAGRARPAELARDLERLSERFEAVPAVATELALVYGQLGWTVEHGRTIEALAQRFSDEVTVLEAWLDSSDRHGKLALADRLVGRIRELDPTNEIAVRRAIRRGDFAQAIAELRRIEALRLEPGNLAIRIADLLVRSGGESCDPRCLQRKLELALEHNPHDAGARLALADARFAAGERRALEEALIDAIRSGADAAELRQAIELKDGATALEPYRRNGRQIVRDTESKGIELPGTAARILDYAALWVAADGSARMLEHTILRVQSREGIAKHAEQRIPKGMLLTLRTIKKDGRVFEPEVIAGKPTLTMPHLEIGDYIETESIWVIPGDHEGRRFRSPVWFFREPNVSYHVSELLVISPKSRPLSIETHGRVPAAVLESTEGLELRRWTVTGALALPEEIGAPPIEEVLPSVQVGWGIMWRDELERISDARLGGYPADPRLVRMAATIAAGKVDRGLAKVPRDERARRIYRWVVDNVRPGPERSAARVVTSKSGDLTEAFIYLCRLAGVDARLGAVKSRLAPPAQGELSGLSAFGGTAVRVTTELGPRWLVVGSRYAPYGFLPSSLADQPAVVLDRKKLPTSPTREPLEEEQTSTGGARDGVVHRGTVTLSETGAATLKLDQEYHGRYAVAVRSALAEVEAIGSGVDDKRRELVEQRLIGGKLPGAQVHELVLHNLDDLDAPLRMTMSIETQSFARAIEHGIFIDVPFLGAMEAMVSLRSRETPLYLDDSARAQVALKFVLPKGAKLATILEARTIDDPRLTVVVADRLDEGVLHVERQVDLPAGRVPPEEYPAFRELVLTADRALNQPLRIEF